MTMHSRWQVVVRAATIAACLAMGVASANASTRVFVRVGPPPAVVDVRPVPPARGYVWVGGYHQWNGGAYVWVPGRWMVPPRSRAVWVAPRWVHERQGWYVVAGHWR